MNSKQFGSSTDEPIGYVEHTFKTKKGERKVKIPVYGFIHKDRSRYRKGVISRTVPEDPTDADIRHIKAAEFKRRVRMMRRSAHAY